MSKKIDEYRVFIASPSDVTDERKIVRDVCEELNNELLVKKDRIQFEAFGWEDVPPEAGRPQEIINKQVDYCDIFVCVFREHFGTPTGKADSGTREEVIRAHNLWKSKKKPHIMIYFKKVENDCIENVDVQLQKLIEFKKEINENKTFFYHEFTDCAKFRKMFTKHMKQWIIDNVKTELTIQELNQLMHKRVINDESYDIYERYKCCPVCGSENLKRSEEVDMDVDESSDGPGDFHYIKISIPGIKCQDCGWSKAETNGSPETFEL